jgi:hypothetical protein
MPLFRPISSFAELPPEGPLDERSREKRDLDFKKSPSGRPWDYAPDVSAFANALGGTILIGVNDEGGRIEHNGLNADALGRAKDIVEQSAAACYPIPAVEAVPIALKNGNYVLSVNVSPSAELVGARAATIERFVDGAWTFRVRRASQNVAIDFRELPMHLDRTSRRAFLLLHQIPNELRGKVLFHYRSMVKGFPEPAQEPMSLEDLPAERNHLVIGRGALRCRVPLRDVEDVWESGDRVWSVRLAGTLDIPPPDSAGYVRYHLRF